MPGPGIHIAVADRVFEHLTATRRWPYRMEGLGQNPHSPTELAAIASAHRNYYALGAVGPDLFFFLPDFRNDLASPLIGVVHFLDDVYAKLDKWILSDWERYFGPGSENIEETISRLTGDLSTVVQDIMRGLSSLLINALLDLAASAHDWWGLFSLGLNKGYDNRDFFWSDMLHYRSTNVFANRLWIAAEAHARSGLDDAGLWSDRLKAYALGYMTHVAADTTGHPFVNEKSGGPFRTHWQRHHLIENHMDARTYDDDHGMDQNYSMFTESALHYRIAFGDDGGDARDRPTFPPGDKTLRGLYVRRRQLDLDSTMPDQLARLLFDAMDATYRTVLQKDLKDNPNRTSPDIIPGGDGRPTPQTIEETYLTLFRYLKLSTLDGFNHEKPTPPEVFPNLDFPQLTDPHDDVPGENDHGMSFWDWLLAILRFLLWIVAVVIWLATILPAIVLDLGTYGPRLLAYYTIELPLFQLLKAERAIMVMTGYFHPMQDEIDNGLVQIGNNNHGNFLTLLSQVDDVLGTGLNVGAPTQEPVPDAQYPHQAKFDEEDLLGRLLHHKSSTEYHHPWDYPDTPVELCHAFAGPFRQGDMPRVLLEDNVPANEPLIGRYAAAPTPFDTDTISFSAPQTANMGDPVNFSSFLIAQLARGDVKESDVTDWNLDADRGYAYKCWDWNRHIEDPTNHLLPDENNHQFVAPCTPPSQAALNDYRGDEPLKIHYLDHKDPGCEGIERCAGVPVTSGVEGRILDTRRRKRVRAARKAGRKARR